MSMHTKQSLDSISQIASADYLASGTSLNEGVTKLARQHDLSDEQVSTVCRLANHHVNAAQMSKEAYTEFPVARPDEVLAALGSDKTAALAVYSTPYSEPSLDKTASADAFEAVVAGDFNKVAKLYGHELVLTGNREEDGVRFVKAAEIVATRALESQLLSKCASEDALGAYYNSIRRSLLDGIPIQDLQSESERTKTADMLKRIWPRLEAEALVQTSIRDDAGPYSLERMYKQAAAMVSHWSQAKAANKPVKITQKHIHDSMHFAYHGYNPDHEDELDGMERAMAMEAHLGHTTGHHDLDVVDHLAGGAPHDLHKQMSAHLGIAHKPANIPNGHKAPAHAVSLFKNPGKPSRLAKMLGIWKDPDEAKTASEDKEALFGMGAKTPGVGQKILSGIAKAPAAIGKMTANSGMGSPAVAHPMGWDKGAEVDPGIKAMQDLLFGPFRIDDNAPLLKQAAAYDASRQRYLIDTRAAQLCIAGIANVDKLAQFDATNRVKTAAAGAARRLTTQALGLGKL